MKKLLLLLIIPLLSFGQESKLVFKDFQLELDTFHRSIPTANFGGQTWRGPLG